MDVEVVADTLEALSSADAAYKKGRSVQTLRGIRGDQGPPEVGVISGADLPASPLGFGTGDDGEVWVGTQDGRVLELAAS